MAFVAAIPAVYFAAAGAAAAVVGTAVSVIGAQQSAAAQRRSADYQAQVAANNATIANQNARYATESGQTAATTQSLRNRAAIGALTTSLAANNVDINTGSAADVRTTQRELGQLDVETTVNNAALTSYGYKAQASGYTGQSSLARAEASQAGTAGNIASAGDLLSGASSLGLKWAQLQNVIGSSGNSGSTATTSSTDVVVGP